MARAKVTNPQGRYGLNLLYKKCPFNFLYQKRLNGHLLLCLNQMDGLVFYMEEIMENALYFLVKYYLLITILLPLLLTYKTMLFIKINNEPQVRPENFMYFSHSNVATTHEEDLQTKKKFQNTLTTLVVVVILLQCILEIPAFINR